MPGLTEFARTGLQVDDAIDQREIADDLCFVTAKTTIVERFLFTADNQPASPAEVVTILNGRFCSDETEIAKTGGRRRATSSPPPRRVRRHPRSKIRDDRPAGRR
jgi:hypothetical protein